MRLLNEGKTIIMILNTVFATLYQIPVSLLSESNVNSFSVVKLLGFELDPALLLQNQYILIPFVTSNKIPSFSFLGFRIPTRNPYSYVMSVCAFVRP